MEQHGIYVGIDVAKAQVDVAIRPGGDRREVSNDPAGIAALVAQMQQLNPAALALEATGGLELPLVAALAAAFLPVVVVNPRQVQDFAKATGGWPKPIPWMRRSWLTSPRPSVLPGVPSGTPRPKSSARWWPADTR